MGSDPSPPWGSYPPPPGNYPAARYGGYPPPSYGSYPAPPGAHVAVGGYPAPPDGTGYPPGEYPPPAPRGFVALPGVGTVAVATFGRRFLARLIDTLIEGVFCAIVVALGVVLANASAHTVIDQNGQPSSEASTLGLVGFFLAVAIGASGPMLYEWLMLAYRGATLGKMALGIRVVNQSTGQNLGHGPAFLRQLVPSAAGLFCFLLTLLVYFSPLFDTSGRLQGWHDRVANDLVIKVR